MTWALCYVAPNGPAAQVSKHRSFPCSSHISLSRATPANHTAPGCGTKKSQGRKQDQHLDVRCRSSQDQEASVQQKGPNISRLAPALQQQWDHAANAHLGPIGIKPYSNRKVWWICDQCPDGHLHSWEATVDNRSNGTGCSQCAGRKVCKHNSLATKAPKVAAQWDYEANASNPDSVTAQSNLAVGWVCEVCGDKWSATPNKRASRNSKTGCPQRYKNKRGKIQIRHPTFAECQDIRGKACLAEWDHERNASKRNFPHNTRLHSAHQIFWLCNKCPAGQQHSWSARPNHRLGKNKSGCPFCAGMAACRCNSLQALYLALAAEWDYAKNHSQPSDHTAGSHSVAWWSKPQCGSWQQSIHLRTTNVQMSKRSKPIQRSVVPQVHPATGLSCRNSNLNATSRQQIGPCIIAASVLSVTVVQLLADTL